jgi:hypothetical protein
MWLAPKALLRLSLGHGPKKCRCPRKPSAESAFQMGMCIELMSTEVNRAFSAWACFGSVSLGRCPQANDERGAVGAKQNLFERSVKCGIEFCFFHVRVRHRSARGRIRAQAKQTRCDALVLARSSGRRTLHKLATLGYASAGTIDGRCQSPPGGLQSRYVGVELFKLPLRHNGPATRCFPFSFQRGHEFPDLSKFKAGLLCRAYDLQLAHSLPWIVAAA